MQNKKFKAYRIYEEQNQYKGKIENLSLSDLPPGELLIKVHYSSLNYKDALSATGNKGVTRQYPHTPGIDAVGTVVESDNHRFQIDDPVIVTSYDLGMNTDGGFAEYIRVPSDWAVPLPEGLSMKEAMIYGTAGFTAGMSIYRLTEGVNPADGNIIVTGATGGVGSIGIAILKKLRYSVTAVTGKESERDYLKQLGAEEILWRKDFENQDKKPLLKPLYAGALDTVGGVFLENIIKSTQPNGTITCCGNVASATLNLSIYPFILRGISLMGIDSQNCPMKQREKVWEQLASHWKPESLLKTYKEIKLDDLDENILLILQGKLKGRVLVNIGE